MKGSALSLLSLLLALPALGIAGGRQKPSDNVYDYIVVGSGPGGGPLASNLARAGYSVLLVEAGSDQSSNINSLVTSFFPFAFTDPLLRWDFFAKNYDNQTRTLQHNLLVWRRTDGTFYVGRQPPPGAVQLGIYYPRGGTLGGSSAVNAMNTILPADSDWQKVTELTGDTTWNPAHMRQIFVRVEKNHYLPPGTPGHGFNGYLDTMMRNSSSFWTPETDLVAALAAVSASLGQNPNDIINNLLADVNKLEIARDQKQGIWGSPLHTSATQRRFSSRDYILATDNAVNAQGKPKYPLYLQLSTLATKILFKDVNHPRKKPQAIGLEYLEGRNLYSADPNYNASNPGIPGRAFARKEVIISGGTFNSPQLLKLSGVGPAAELAQFNIPLVAHLPGVGTKLQDNYEVPTVGLAARNFVTTNPPPDPNAPVCTFGAPNDPCVTLWQQGTGPYTVPGALNAIFRKTPFTPNNERDMYLVGGQFAIRGFIPPTDSVNPFGDPPNTFGLSTVKIHPQSTAGTVLLRSGNPRDVPDINFHLFEQNTPGTGSDLEAELDTVKWARRVFASVPPPLGPIVPTEPPCLSPSGTPAADGTCDDAADIEFIKNQIFGHHPTSSCAIGAESDPYAVLDSKFRVRGVRGLRVVDASAFPRVPGAFPVLPTFMLSEKATESVLQDAGSW
ncbi:GMC oxidoreductase-like protein [Podospora didyma]|uniref:GMC oxidoreductase-like protein n=1 Tax=Podospora didyma TaxID=330526 RepID=A0AAE0KJX4_9PEZI|nr:GMC oxidoreductase-like protein [Podospora didyma]